MIEGYLHYCNGGWDGADLEVGESVSRVDLVMVGVFVRLY